MRGVNFNLFRPRWVIQKQVQEKRILKVKPCLTIFFFYPKTSKVQEFIVMRTIKVRLIFSLDVRKCETQPGLRCILFKMCTFLSFLLCFVLVSCRKQFFLKSILAFKEIRGLTRSEASGKLSTPLAQVLAQCKLYLSHVRMEGRNDRIHSRQEEICPKTSL